MIYVDLGKGRANIALLRFPENYLERLNKSGLTDTT